MFTTFPRITQNIMQHKHFNIDIYTIGGANTILLKRQKSMLKNQKSMQNRFLTQFDKLQNTQISTQWIQKYNINVSFSTHKAIHSLIGSNISSTFM